jgi:hypothetical protein
MSGRKRNKERQKNYKLQRNFSSLDNIKKKSQRQFKEPKDRKNPVKKILTLSSNPKATSHLRLDEEIREVEEGLKRSKYRDKFDIQPKLAVRLRDFRRAILDYEPHIVHFKGHGGKNGLMVENEMGFAILISADALSGLFELCSNQVECVILSACYSEDQATAISRHINYVIGMRKEISDKAAIEFSVGFYDALGAGKSVEEAFKFGCNAILQMYPYLPEHLIPVLIKRKNLKKHNSDIGTLIGDRKKEMVKIQVLIETTGDMVDVRVPLDARTSAIKKHLINELKLTNILEDGPPVPYKLLSKMRGEVMDDVKTLRENDVQGNEIFVFMLDKKTKKIFKQLGIALLLLLLIPIAYFTINRLLDDWGKLYVTNLSFINELTFSPIEDVELKNSIDDAVMKGMLRAIQPPVKHFSFKISDAYKYKDKLKNIIFASDLTRTEKIKKIIVEIMNPMSIDAIVSVFYICHGSYIIVRPFIIVKSIKKIVTENLQFSEPELFCQDSITKEKILCFNADKQIFQAVQKLVRRFNLENMYIKSFPFLHIKSVSFGEPSIYSFMKDREEEELINKSILKGIYEIQGITNSNHKFVINASGHTIRNSDYDVKDFVDIIFDQKLAENDKINKIISEIMIPNNVDIIVTGMCISKDTLIIVHPMVIVKPLKKIIFKSIGLNNEDIDCSNSISNNKSLSPKGYGRIVRAVQEMLEYL